MAWLYKRVCSPMRLGREFPHCQDSLTERPENNFLIDQLDLSMEYCNYTGCLCKNLYVDWSFGNRSGPCEDCHHPKTDHAREAGKTDNQSLGSECFQSDSWNAQEMFEPAICNTSYERHLGKGRDGEDKCPVCKQAVSLHQKERTEAANGPPQSDVVQQLTEKFDAMSLDIKLSKAGRKGDTTTALLWQHGVQDETIRPKNISFTDELVAAADCLLPGRVWVCGGGSIKVLERDFIAPADTPEKDMEEDAGKGAIKSAFKRTVTKSTAARHSAAEDSAAVYSGTRTHFARAMEAIVASIQSDGDTHHATLYRQGGRGHEGRYKAAGEPFRVHSVPDCHAYRNSSFLLRHPFVFYDHPTHRGIRRMTLLGDVHPRMGHFTDAAKGAIIDFAKDFLLHAQPERKFVTVFLTDSSAFQFYKVERVAAEEFRTTESDFLDGVGTGWKILFSLMMRDPHELGYGEIEIPGITLGQHLGEGANSISFAVDGAPQRMYAKVYRNGATCTVERECLTALTSAQLAAEGRVPTLVQAAGDQPLRTLKGDDVLFLSPVACRVLSSCRAGDGISGLSQAVPLRGAHFRWLVETVETMHATGWAHRDIKPDNVLFNSITNNVMLIDFDSAVRLDVAAIPTWRGTPSYFDPVYDSCMQRDASAALYLCKCDLRCLVRTVYVLNSKVDPLYRGCETSEQVALFWQEHLSSELWARALEMVESMTAVGQAEPYEALRDLWKVL